MVLGSPIHCSIVIVSHVVDVTQAHLIQWLTVESGVMFAALLSVLYDADSFEIIIIIIILCNIFY